MPKKQSIKLAVKQFLDDLNETDEFLKEIGMNQLSKSTTSRAYEWALIEVYRSFEKLMLNVLVAHLNENPQHFSTTTGTTFPRHMKTEVCQHLVTNGGYFDFKGREGLLKEVKRVVPAEHWLYKELKKQTYSESLSNLVALRNYAAHGSEQSKQAVKKALGHLKLGSAGSWAKVSGRFEKLTANLRALAEEIEKQARF
ncbi:hypothetical protein [Mycolicibacterium fortuitum]|uniref:RiboL-PSP-HEPN domain-containing protein n=2 Tax=Mycolicibacterium fortuitum TaxID=1766 RepID=A0AAE4VI99_MYCFO|nr:hypothetical protein [Mycolicibacterium fortuitum]MCV7139989.1 hypothetical protein [Mycolicibacterium fortuitum]MDV7195468.1 hypothetical protein [Mycolicibacterium fortuitum]MDV7209341.1 hypothetical protein [Mycolicibacterium fortuitum]MDV7231187.1 hypothetical protein [Mycolicibacterium fortuitum]MDV7262588.1 hypothetical protein [Mycolicibacterium fortuitum]